MTSISKVWIDGEWLYVKDTENQTHRQSLLWYPQLRGATAEQSKRFKIGMDGIHWPELDVDVSFESFEYEDAEPTKVQRFFLTHPEISIKGFAERFGISEKLLQRFIKGFQTPMPSEEALLLENIKALGKEIAQYA